jgi:hypothetical protein
VEIADFDFGGGLDCGPTAKVGHWPPGAVARVDDGVHPRMAGRHRCPGRPPARSNAGSGVIAYSVFRQYIPPEIVLLGMIVGRGDNLAVGQAFSKANTFSDGEI